MQTVPVDTNLATARAEARLFHSEFGQRARQFFIDQALESISVGRDVETQLPPKEASQALQPAVDQLTEWARQKAQAYPAYAWLRFLRDMPSEFYRGHLMGHAAYQERRMTAEIVSGWSLAGVETTFDANRLPLDDCLHLIEVANALTRLRVMQRTCAKDVPLIFRPDGLPLVDEQHPNWRAVQTLDKRVSGWDQINLQAGTVGLAVVQSDPGLQANVIQSCLLRPHVEPEMFTAEPMPLVTGSAVADWSFSFEGWATPVPELLGRFGMTSPGLLEAMVLHMTVSMLIGVFGESALVQAARLGYFNLRAADWDEVLKLMLGHPQVTELATLMGLSSELNVEQLQVQAAESGSLDGLSPGPVVRPIYDTGSVLIDVWASSNRVIRRLGLHSPGGDSATAERGLHFEQELQRLIDQTPWAPPEQLRQYVGRKLRRANGSILTDVDCIAFRDGVCIFIDAKSLASSKMIEGDWGAVTEARRYLEKSWAKWVRNVALIEAEPKHGNYDFSCCDRFVPLIVTVAPQYTYTDLLEPLQLNRLHPVASMTELLMFLQDESQTAE